MMCHEEAKSMTTLNEKQATLFTDRNWGVIATVREDGSPHATPVWIDYDGENVLVNSAYGGQRSRTLSATHEQPSPSYPRRTSRAAM